MVAFAYKPKLVQVCCIFLTVLALVIVAHDEGAPWAYAPAGDPLSVQRFEPAQSPLVWPDLRRLSPGATAPMPVLSAVAAMAGATAAVPTRIAFTDSA